MHAFIYEWNEPFAFPAEAGPHLPTICPPRSDGWLSWPNDVQNGHKATTKRYQNHIHVANEKSFGHQIVRTVRVWYFSVPNSANETARYKQFPSAPTERGE